MLGKFHNLHFDQFYSLLLRLLVCEEVTPKAGVVNVVNDRPFGWHYQGVLMLNCFISAEGYTRVAFFISLYFKRLTEFFWRQFAWLSVSKNQKNLGFRNAKRKFPYYTFLLDRYPAGGLMVSLVAIIFFVIYKFSQKHRIHKLQRFFGKIPLWPKCGFLCIFKNVLI